MFYEFHNVDVNISVSDLVTKDNNTVNGKSIIGVNVMLLHNNIIWQVQF